MLLTIFDAHKTIGHQLETRGTSAGDARTALIDTRRRQTEMRAVSIDRLTVIDTIWLAIRMIHVHDH